ncbi:hypothetical protein MMC13_006833 [Lambiella insularis]|nr:hypothetical protein [Lambiella insularis]
MAFRPSLSFQALFRLPKRPVRTSSTALQPRFPQARFASQHPFPHGTPRGRPQYNRFSRSQSIKYLWQTNMAFRYGAGAVGTGFVGFVGYNIETVPASGRRRFNWVSPEYEQQMGQQRYRQIIQEYQGEFLPEWHIASRMVQRVLKRLISANGIENQDWEVHVIDDPSQMNAFVIPGGKVFVFSGLLPICDGDDGLAAVLGHEIAHNVAHHSAENYSRLSLAIPIAYLASFIYDISGNLTFMIMDYAYNKPGSRKQESEADFIGLMMMAQSCYNPEAALGLWQRMEKAGGSAVPQFMSTHPSNYNRIAKIQQWLPQAQEKRAASECGGTIQYADEFKKAFQSREEDFW